jgi:hypothetical protein
MFTVIGCVHFLALLSLGLHVGGRVECLCICVCGCVSVNACTPDEILPFDGCVRSCGGYDTAPGDVM